mgnify:CR=1 FL=1
MSDVSDPEDEIVEIRQPAAPQCSGDHGPHGHSHGPPAGHGHAHGGPPRRVVPKAPPGSDKWPAIYPLYINKLRSRQQVCLFYFFEKSLVKKRF